MADNFLNSNIGLASKIFKLNKDLDPFVEKEWKRIFLQNGHYMPDQYFYAMQQALSYCGETSAMLQFLIQDDDLSYPVSFRSMDAFSETVLAPRDGSADFEEYVIFSSSLTWGLWADGNNAAILSGDQTFTKAFFDAFGGESSVRADTNRYIQIFENNFQSSFISLVRSF